MRTFDLEYVRDRLMEALSNLDEAYKRIDKPKVLKHRLMRVITRLSDVYYEVEDRLFKAYGRL